MATHGSPPTLGRRPHPPGGPNGSPAGPPLGDPLDGPPHHAAGDPPGAALDDPPDGGELFRRFSQRTAAVTGSAGAFALAVVVVAVWGVTGPLFHFSDAWQLVINTGTTIITFLMVFLIQATQNRDGRAVHLKLDELLRAVEAARTSMVDLENRSDAELDRIRAEFGELRTHAEREAARLAAGEAERREATGRRVGDRVR